MFGRLQQHCSSLSIQLTQLTGHYEKGREDARVAAQTVAAEREVLVRVLRDHQNERTKWEGEKEKLSQSLTTALSQLTMMHKERAQEQDQETEQIRVRLISFVDCKFIQYLYPNLFCHVA
jgi:hypothetical protein